MKQMDRVSSKKVHMDTKGTELDAASAHNDWW
jgi:hypothetical protein